MFNRRHGLFYLLACFAWACGGASTSPETFPDLAGAWTGNVTIVTASLGGAHASVVCIHQWNIASSAGGAIAGTWHSSPDPDAVPGGLGFVPGCEQSGALSGNLSSAGAINLSFETVLGATGCTRNGENAMFSGSEALGRISASGQDMISCPGVPNELRTISFSMYKQ